MASHFSSIGIIVKDQQDFMDYFKLAYEKGEKIKTKKGTYIKWHIGNGVELWGQLSKDNAPIGMNPHFSGNSELKVRIKNRVTREGDTILDGALYCWLDAEGEGDGYPFVFDIPDIETYKEFRNGEIVMVQVTGFAHEISAYKNEEEFNNSQIGELKFASRSFIPAGLFNPNGEGEAPPQANAIFTGFVTETNKVRNPYTNQEFIYAKVNTLGGDFDIVVDPDILKGDICINGVVTGMFWLSGKLIDKQLRTESNSNKFSWLRLFNEK